MSIRPIICKQLFAAIRDHRNNEDYSFTFTDGDKANKTTSFSVAEENDRLISSGQLFPYVSILTAEGWAILTTRKHAAKIGGKFIICSDSKRFISGVLNSNCWTNQKKKN